MNKLDSVLLFDDGYPKEFDLAHEARLLVNELLIKFNARSTKLFDVLAHKRIFLFILTRSIKTYSSIFILCERGYGQDVATLLRGLVEHLITARYILHDRKQADHLAERFVAYKWIIFKRSLPEQEKALRTASKEKKAEFYKRKALVMQQVDVFRKKFKVTSDRGLLTWSGKTVRDMAKHVDPLLLAEYDETFRHCSKFSHPTILGDQEYMIQDNNELIFSPLPSAIGVLVNLRATVRSFLEFASLADEQFDLDMAGDITDMKRRLDQLRAESDKPYSASSVASSTSKVPPIRECRVVFSVLKP